jgi:hypothetical protein
MEFVNALMDLLLAKHVLFYLDAFNQILQTQISAYRAVLTAIFN